MFSRFIAKYSKELLLLGFNNPKVDQNALSFNVYGKKYNGEIKILNKATNYTVIFHDCEFTFRKLDQEVITTMFEKIQPKNDKFPVIFGEK